MIPRRSTVVPVVVFALALGSAGAACGGSDAGVSPAVPDVDGSSPDAMGDGGGGSDGAANDAGGSDTDPSSGCATGAGIASGTSVATVTVGAATRSFRIHAPPGHTKTKPAPLVLVFHGGGGSAEQIELASSKMNPIADREGFIAVYPDGTGLVKTWNGGGCCGKASADDVDDVGFVAALLDDVMAKTCIDKRRVFATGMSNGALLSHRLGCELSERIAAIAPVAGTIAVPSCTPAKKVAVMHVHGTLDGHVPWDGGVGCGPSSYAFTSVPTTIDGWRTRNGCTAATAPYFQQGDGTCVAYQGCQSPLVLCSIEGGGHSWPGGEPKARDAGVDCPADGSQSTTFIASEAIWSFFRANPRVP